MPMPSVALLVAAVRVSAASARGIRTARGSRRGLTPVRDATLPAYCRRAHGLTIGRIGCRRRRDANADGGGANGHGGDDSGDLFHGLISNLATAPTISRPVGQMPQLTIPVDEDAQPERILKTLPCSIQTNVTRDRPHVESKCQYL